MISYFIVSAILIVLIGVQFSDAKSQAPICTWDSKSGGKFDLRPLIIQTSESRAYEIIDGDIPCTPEKEPSFGYIWNFCEQVPSSKVPEPCRKMGRSGVVLQWATYSEDDYYCYVIGHYDSTQHELKYSLLDIRNPAKGVSISYPAGEKCSSTNKKPRTATIDVECANVRSAVASAQEPNLCEYHLQMKSYYGCPTECPVTGNGLCNSHGHCAYDNKAKTSYCYCNEGYYGAACDSTSSGQPASYDGYSVQLGLLITLLIIALALTGGVVYLAFRVGQFRKDQVSSHYTHLPSESEMVETVNFR